MAIKIETGNELNRLLEALHKEIVDATIYYRLFCDLNNAFEGYSKEFAQSNTFWELTFVALQDAWSIRLCRVFDQQSDSLTINNLLETIKKNLHFFDEENFRERLKDNAFVNSLAEQCRIPNQAQLERDIEFASCRNPSVKKLMIWRNNIIAHKGSKLALGKADKVLDNSITHHEIERLLDEGFELFNRYARLYNASSWSRTMIGHNDYQYLLNLIRLGLQKHEEDIQKEIDQIS